MFRLHKASGCRRSFLLAADQRRTALLWAQVRQPDQRMAPGSGLHQLRQPVAQDFAHKAPLAAVVGANQVFKDPRFFRRDAGRDLLAQVERASFTHPIEGAGLHERRHKAPYVSERRPRSGGFPSQPSSELLTWRLSADARARGNQTKA